MFKTQQIYDLRTPQNQWAAEQIRQILLSNFKWLTNDESKKWINRISQPRVKGFSYFFLAAYGRGSKVRGVSVFSIEDKTRFGYLDFIAVDTQLKSSGVGGALYWNTRRELVERGARGMFIEAQKVDESLPSTSVQYRQNKARMKFYEQVGAERLSNDLHEQPRKGGLCYSLLYDGGGAKTTYTKKECQEVTSRILEVKDSGGCSKSFISKACTGISTAFVSQLNQLASGEPKVKIDKFEGAENKQILLTVNEGHEIHHIQDKGYEESPVRLSVILSHIEPTQLFERIETKHFSDSYIKAVHNPEYIKYLKTICESIGNNAAVYPEVFPVRATVRAPKNLPHRVGYYCIDSFSPLNANAYLAARGAVDCALTAAEHIQKGKRLAYALVRPPGHHAEKSHFGGFCYMNSTAIAANYLSKSGKVAILDVDYHHGNGQQDIFYDRSDVFTVSLHADPMREYPYFSGFKEEVGSGKGKGYNLNIPLEMGSDWAQYQVGLKAAMTAIEKFDPAFLVIALGFDTAKRDPTGSFKLGAKDFQALGKSLSHLKLATLMVQEGGYRTATLGKNASMFFKGLWEGYYRDA